MGGNHNGLLSRAFRWYGSKLAHHPCLFVAFAVVFAGILTVGMKDLTIDTDPNLIWVPPTSTTALQKTYFDAAFDPFFRINQAIISLDESASGENVAAAGALTREYMMAVLGLQQLLVNTSATDGTMLNDVCYKPIAGAGCLIETPLDYIFSDGTVLAALNDSDIQRAVDCITLPQLQAAHSNYQACFSPIHTPIMPSVVLGGTSSLRGEVAGYSPSVCGGNGTYATSLVLTFLLQATPELTDKGARWEQDVFIPLVSSFTHPGLRVSYMAQRSLADEIEVVDQQNQYVVIISYAVMFAYITVALGKFPHPIFTRALLGLQGIIIVALSVVAAIGICSWGGLHITMIVNEVVPFLILALGVDNMFILSKAFDRHWRGPYRGLYDPVAIAWAQQGQRVEPMYSGRCDPGEAIMNALADVGPTISAAAVSEVLAFGVGATTEIPALQQFCLVAAVAVAIDFVLQITWFSAALMYDAWRQESYRLDCFPLFKMTLPQGMVSALAMAPTAPSSRTSRASASSINDGGGEYAKPHGTDAMHDDCSPRVLHHNGSLGEALLGVHDKPTMAYMPDKDAPETSFTLRQRCRLCVLQGAYVRRACTHFYAPWLLWTPVRILVIATWLLFLGGSGYGLTQLKLGLEQQLVLPQGSYLTQYFDDQSLLGEAGPPVYLVLQNVNYSHPDTVDAVESMVEEISALTRWIEPPISNWLNDYAYWRSNTSQTFIRKNPSTGCPLPLDPNTTPLAQQVAQMILDVPITSPCCQANAYCSAQFSTDVKFLWGVPKNSSISTAAKAAGVPLPPGAMGAIDDGGCDLTFGYVSHDEVEAAMRHQVAWVTGRALRANDPTPLRSTVFLHPYSAQALPTAFKAQVSRVWHRMSAVGLDASALPSALPVDGSGLATSDMLPLIPCHVFTSRLRSQLVPLHNQSDFINVMQHVQAAVSNLQSTLPTVDLSLYGLTSQSDAAGISGTFIYNFTSDNEHLVWLNPAPGGAAFPYSLTFVYYEQYNFIRGVAVTCILIAVGAVYLASFIVTSFPVALTTALTVLCITTDIIGFVWVLNPTGNDPYGQGPYGVDINAVSVVNLVAAVGLSVEFCIHLSSYFSHAVGDRITRVKAALINMGSSVFTGITITKFVGVSILAWAPSHLFQLYYFRMYIAIIIFGAFHGLMVLPVILSIVGWPSETKGEGSDGGKSEQDAANGVVNGHDARITAAT